MALKVGTSSVTRLYKKLPNPQFVYYGTSIPPAALSYMVDFDPAGHACSVVGEFVGYVSGSGTTYYRCDELSNPQVEVTHLRDSQNQTIHKRVTITFAANGGSGGSSQTRTWGVEQITQPSTPTRSNYTFNGWYTAASGGTKLTFPRTTPINNTTYYAQWTASTPPGLKWRFNRTLPSQSFCFDQGFSLIGTSCTTLNATETVSGYHDGYSGCIELICKA